MSEESSPDVANKMIKVVYFDEQSASDYLDISAGGKSVTKSEQVAKRASEVQATVQAKLAAKLSWLPFLDASAEAGGGGSASRTGQNLLSKTLSNTILTDYLVEVEEDSRIVRLSDYQVLAVPNSFAYMKMYTPYMVAAKSEEQGIDLARLDEALESAKGYYELLARSGASKRIILRFNFKGFRNNYGLTDLGRMNLTFHGIKVGKATEADLEIEAEMKQGRDKPELDALSLVQGTTQGSEVDAIDVYDVMLAGIELAE